MNRLNGARRELKHRGTTPARSEVIDFVGMGIDFLTKHTFAEFAVEYAHVSLISLIRSTVVRGRLKSAETAIDRGEGVKALEAAAKAFDLLLYQLSRDDRKSLLTPELNELRYASSNLRPAEPGSAFEFIADRLEGIQSALLSVGQVVQLLGFGVDLAGYFRFRSLTPAIQTMPGGQRQLARWSPLRPKPEQVSDEDVFFCVDFVVEAALRLQDRGAMR